MAIALDGTTGYLEWNKGGGSLPVTGLPLTIVACVASLGLTGTQQFMVASQQAAGGNGAYLFGDSGNSSVSIQHDSAAATKTINLPSSSLALLVGELVAVSGAGARLMYANSASSPGTDSGAAAADLNTHDRITIGCAHNAGLAARLFANVAIEEVHLFASTPSANDTGSTGQNDVVKMLAGTLPETLTGWVDGWDLRNYQAGGTYLSMSGTRTMTAVGGVSSSAIAHYFTRNSSSFAGAVTLDAATVGGGFATSPSSFAGAVTLDDVAVGGGGFGAQAGNLVVGPVKNWFGQVQANITVPKLAVLRLSDMSTVANLTNQATNSSGMFTLTGVYLVPGADYLVVSSDATGATLGCELVRAQ